MWSRDANWNKVGPNGIMNNAFKIEDYDKKGQGKLTRNWQKAGFYTSRSRQPALLDPILPSKPI